MKVCHWDSGFLCEPKLIYSLTNSLFIRKKKQGLASKSFRDVKTEVLKDFDSVMSSHDNPGLFSPVPYSFHNTSRPRQEDTGLEHHLHGSIPEMFRSWQEKENLNQSLIHLYLAFGRKCMCTSHFSDGTQKRSVVLMFIFLLIWPKMFENLVVKGCNHCEIFKYHTCSFNLPNEDESGDGIKNI